MTLIPVSKISVFVERFWNLGGAWWMGRRSMPAGRGAP